MSHPLIHESITRPIIGRFFEVYNKLGFGFLESIHVAALERELKERGCVVGREVQVRVRYKGCDIGRHRLDMLVNERVDVEVKSCATHPGGFASQVCHYLRAAGLDVGLLLHFGHEPRFDRCLNPAAPRSASTVVSP